MAQFHLSPITPSDLNALVEVYTSAFSPTKMYTMLFPPTTCPPSSVRPWLHARFSKTLSQAHAEMHLTKIADAATGRVVAWCRWGSPVSLGEEEERRRGELRAREEREREEGATAAGCDPRWPVGANAEACAEYFGLMDGMREKYVKMEEDYIIYLLATDPEFQRRGLGAMLLGQVIALAEAEGRRIYLEATLAGHPLYLKLGWRDVDLITVDCRKWGLDQSECNWIMLREPQAKV